MCAKQGKVSFKPFPRLLIKILIFCIITGVSVLALYPVNKALLGAMTDIRNELLALVEEYTGYKLEYGSMQPSVFTGFDVRNLAVVRDDGSILLSVSRLKINYSLPLLLRGNTFDAIRSIHVDRPVLNFEIEKDKTLVNIFSGVETEAGMPDTAVSQPPAELFPRGANIRIRNGEWLFNYNNLEFKTWNINFDAALIQNKIDFEGGWTVQGVLTDPESDADEFSAVMIGQIKGDYGNDIGNSVVTIQALTGESLSLKPFSFNVLLNKEFIEIKRSHYESLSDIVIHYDIENSDLNVLLKLDDFSPQSIISLDNPWSAYNSFLEARLNGQAYFNWAGKDSFDYNLDLTGVFPIETPLGMGDLEIAADGDTDKITFNKFNLNLTSGNFSYTGELFYNPLSPNGLLSISEFGFYGSNKERISVDIILKSDDKKIEITGESLTAGELVLSKINAAVYRDLHGLSFELSAQKNNVYNSFRPDNSGSLLLEGFFDDDPRNLWASASVNAITLRDAAELIRPFSGFKIPSGTMIEIFDDYELTTEIFFNTDYTNMLYNATHFEIRSVRNQEIIAASSFSGTGQRLEINNSYISVSGSMMEINAFADYSNPDDIRFTLWSSYKTLTYQFEGYFLDRNTISINGLHGFDVYLSSSGMTSWSGYARAANFPIHQEEQAALMSFLISLHYDSPEFWSSEVENFEIINISTPMSPAVLKFKAAADQNGLELTELYFDDRIGTLTGGINLNWDTNYQNFELSAELGDTNIEEQLNLHALYENTIINLDFTGENIQLDRFIGHFNAVASAKISLNWESINKFRAESELSSLTLRFRGKDAGLSAKAIMDTDEFHLYDVLFHYDEIEASAPFLLVNRAKGLAETKAQIIGMLDSKEVDIDINAHAEFNSINTWLHLSHITESLKGTLNFDKAQYDTHVAEEPFNFDFSSFHDEVGRRISLNGGPKNMVRFLYTSAANTEGGNFYAALSGPSPVRGSLTGYIDNERIDAHTSDLYVDLGTLWTFIPPQRNIEFSGGIVNASVNITGPLREPEFFGSARAVSVKIQVPQHLRADIRPVPMLISLAGNEINFGPVNVNVGNGAGVVSAWFRFDGWIPNIFEIDINVPASSPIPFGIDESGVIAAGSATGNIKLAMEDRILNITGDLTAQNAEISLNAEEITMREDGEMVFSDRRVASILDLSIKAGRRVEFFWPSFEFPIIQAHADLGTGIHISSDASNRQFRLNGNVKLRGGEIYYLERSFYIREGTLFFRETEIEFDPRISARAEIRDQGPEGPVIISMVIDNSPLLSFTPRFESSPSLSQLEIFSILGLNPYDDPLRNRNMLVAGGIDALTQFTVLRQVQRTVRNTLGLDMFSIRTQAIQNMIFQAAGMNDFPTDVPGGQELTWNRLGMYFDRTTLFMGKFIGADMFAQALLSFTYDDDRQTMGGIFIEPEISLEISNPIFDIQFNLNPLHRENWFIDGASFTLTWRNTF